MKKSLLLVTLFVTTLCLSSKSQVISKGDKLFGAGASVYFYHQDNQNPNTSQYPVSSSNVSFIPSFSWAVKKNMTIGIKGSLGYARSVGRNSSGKNIYTTFEASPELFLKKYKELKDRFGLSFANGLYGYFQMNKQKVQPDVFKTKIWGGGYNFTPGVYYKFSDRFLGETNLGGLFAQYASNAGTKNYTAGATFLRYFNISFNYIIGRRA